MQIAVADTVKSLDANIDSQNKTLHLQKSCKWFEPYCKPEPYSTPHWLEESKKQLHDSLATLTFKDLNNRVTVIMDKEPKHSSTQNIAPNWF